MAFSRSLLVRPRGYDSLRRGRVARREVHPVAGPLPAIQHPTKDVSPLKSHLGSFAATRSRASLFKPPACRGPFAPWLCTADPMRRAARAQDLISRSRCGLSRRELERRYPRLAIEEPSSSTTVSCSHDFVPPPSRGAPALGTHGTPRCKPAPTKCWPLFAARFHPRQVCAGPFRTMAASSVGRQPECQQSSARGLHYRGLLRVARREADIDISSDDTRRKTTAPRHASRAPAQLRYGGAAVRAASRGQLGLSVQTAVL